MMYRQPFTHLLSACLLSCNGVAASRMQIVLEWPPVACKFRLILFMLHATGGHAATIYMQLAATRVQFKYDWPPVACKLCMRL
jgi:hypothetical protein